MSLPSSSAMNVGGHAPQLRRTARLSLLLAMVGSGAGAYVANGEGNTPMMVAAYKGHRAVTRVLLLHQLRHGGIKGSTDYSPNTRRMKIPEYALEFRASGRWMAKGDD